MHQELKTYDSLYQWIRLFNQGDIPLLILEGKPGIGKTQAIHKVLAESHEEINVDCCYLSGRLSASAFYTKLYEYRDLKFYCDDCQAIAKNAEILGILMQLCNSMACSTRSEVQWTIQRRLNDTIPNRFTTHSTLCLLINEIKHVPALHPLLDRAVHCVFTPSYKEIHAYAQHYIGTWCHADVHAAIGMHLPYINNLSLRMYQLLSSFVGKTDWQKILYEQFSISAAHRMVLELQSLFPDCTHEERADYFKQETGKSKRTYWRLLEDIHDMQGSTPA